MTFRDFISGYWRDVRLNVIIASPLVPRAARWRFLRLNGMRVERCTIAAKGFYGGNNIDIHEGAYINYGVYLDNAARVVIGPRAQLGPGVRLLTGTHRIGDSTVRAGAAEAGAVTIGAGAWIGADVLVMPGVVIGDGAVVGAGSVVTKNCDANSLYVGVPARLVRRLPA